MAGFMRTGVEGAVTEPKDESGRTWGMMSSEGRDEAVDSIPRECGFFCWRGMTAPMPSCSPASASSTTLQRPCSERGTSGRSSSGTALSASRAPNSILGPPGAAPRHSVLSRPASHPAGSACRSVSPPPSSPAAPTSPSRFRAACLCPGMSGLGTLGCRQAASTLGLSPGGRDRARHMDGGRTRGGCARLRRVLSPVALSAARFESDSQARCGRRADRGNSRKVAVAAEMRRSACLLGTLLRGTVLSGHSGCA